MDESGLPGQPAERATPAVQAAGAAVAAEQPQEHRIQEGENVVLHVNSERRVVLRVKSNGSRVKLGQYRCALDVLVGSQYGSLFGLAPDGASLQPVEHMPSMEWDTAAAPETAKDNSSLIDNNNNQQLDSETIQEMRAAGKTGDEIVAALAAGSTTFHSKTEFAQEKYKRKKARKHGLLVAALQATPAAVCEAHYSSSPAKIGFMRVDTMAIMLSLANVAAYAHVLVVETCGGLLTAAAAERLGGHGSVHSVWLGPKPPSWDVWRQCSLSAAARQAVKFASLGELLQLGGTLEAASTAAAADKQLVAGSAAKDDMQQAAIDLGGAFDSCLIAAPRIGATELLRTLRPLLAPSASFALYSPYTQPLGEALQDLRRSGQAVNLALQEGWWRELQVLPARTHPMMQMNHGGGLILSGTMRLQKAETRAEATAAGDGKTAKRQHVG